MGRDSLARHKMCRLWGNRDDLPTLSFGKSTCCRTRVLIRPTDPQNKHAPMGRGYFLADGEGFEPPVELPPQRFSRPSQSTALPPILNFFPTVSQPTVLFAYRTWRCCSPLVRTRLRCACLADSYARPSQSTALPPIQSFFTAGLSTCGFVRCSHLSVDERRVLYSTNIALSIYLFIYIIILACVCDHVIITISKNTDI